MRRQTPIAHLLYSCLYPHPTVDDPPSFSAHLAKNLVQEVRMEVQVFYGELTTIEAKYPGLDYCYGPHRMRLGRYKHHARLFAAFEALNLTYQEIQDFCCWEGTRWARERYEKDEACTIADTTGDNIPTFVDRKLRKAFPDEPRRGSITRKTDISVVFQDAPRSARNSRARQQAAIYVPTTADDPELEDDHMSDSASDTTASPQSEEDREVREDNASATVEFSRARIEALERQRDQLQAAIAQGAPLTPEQEQLLKDQHEWIASQGLDIARSVGHSQRALSGEANTSARAAA
ncbi:hypothetical protein Q7P37_004712 [Cladosporium fusiforme]